MCRAIRVVILASSDESAQALRRAVGAEAEVVGTVRTSEDLASVPGEYDILLVEGAAEDLLGTALERNPKAGVVWAGTAESAPSAAHSSVEFGKIGDDLPSAIVKALIARR
jgi:hypothetical protein